MDNNEFLTFPLFFILDTSKIKTYSKLKWYESTIYWKQLKEVKYK